MNINIDSPQTSTYTVATPVYEGPLDLLLKLIEKAELDITKLALAQVTDQYLEHLKIVKEHSPDEVSAFIVIAARLIQIKSEALLPRPPQREEGEEDPGEALARQLREYKRFKQVSESLSKRELDGLHSYIRLAPIPYIEPTIDIGDIDVFDLMEVAFSLQTIAAQKTSGPSIEGVVAAPRITIRKKINLIANRLKVIKHATFRSMLGRTRTRIEIVVTFLAMLELVKRHWIRANQDQLFGEIELELADRWGDDSDIELEFGE
jgi:segregation and condensation protein A